MRNRKKYQHNMPWTLALATAMLVGCAAVPDVSSLVSSSSTETISVVPIPTDPPPITIESPQPTIEAVPTPTVQQPLQVTYYRVKSGIQGLRLRSEPNVNSAIVDQLGDWGSDIDQFCVISEKDGWAYGIFAGQTGWCSLDYLEPAPDYTYLDTLIPDFLTPEQQLVYLCAKELFDYSRWCSGADYEEYIYLPDKEYFIYPVRTYQGSYTQYLDTARALYTQDAVESWFSELYINYSGKLYAISGGGGYNMALQSYEFRLEYQTDTEVSFTLICHCDPVYGDRDFLLSMEKCSDGQWRFKTMATIYNGPMILNR